jgi:hypothetical protein
MLISYPILPTRPDTETEEDYLTRILTNHVNSTTGRYPVSSLRTGLGVEHHWHGGLHLIGGGEPIRAIADGTVAAYRVASQTETYPGQGTYDTSFVLLRHETQSGEHTTVVFYSLYMHLALRSSLAPDRLSQMPTWLRNATPGAAVQTAPTQRVWRKEVLGFAGQLYGREACHFEVFTTPAALNTFWRDSTTVTQGNGGADFFGDAHFIIPANQTFAVRHPRATTGAQHQINFAGNANYPLPLGQAGNNTTQLFVSMRLDRGRRIATTYEAGPHNTFRQLGDPVDQADYEYELYRLATALYPDCPSAGYEWLRFGRILSADTTTRNENWQLVRYSATAMGYINLAPQAVAKLSDADFVHWQGWEKHDEGTTANAADGLCDDAQVIALAQATDADSQRKLRHFICKHPTEWDASDLPARFARHRQPGQALADSTAWTDFERHVQNMAFWPSAGIADRSIWHFHPLQFVYHYRKCGWLSVNELAQCLPRRSISDNNLTWATALGRAQTHNLHLNHYFRKYKGNSKKRAAHALAQIYIETGLLRTMTEDDLGNGHAYTAFYGRGYNQLTWAGNFKIYGDFKALPNHAGAYTDRRITATSTHAIDSGGATMRWAPRYDPNIVATDLTHSADSSGMFWVSKSFRGRKNINRVSDLAFTPTSVAFTCWLINGGGAGYANRQQFGKYLSNVLFDEPLLTGSIAFTYPPLSPAGNPALCVSFPPAIVPFTQNGTAHYDKQAAP